MPFGTITLSQTPYTPDSLASTQDLLANLDLGIVEVTSCIEDATAAAAKLKDFRELLASRISEGTSLSKRDLDELKRLALYCSLALTDGEAEECGDESALYHVSTACEFMLGEEVEMSNGDKYRGRVLVSTRLRTDE